MKMDPSSIHVILGDKNKQLRNGGPAEKDAQLPEELDEGGGEYSKGLTASVRDGV